MKIVIPAFFGFFAGVATSATISLVDVKEIEGAISNYVYSEKKDVIGKTSAQQLCDSLKDASNESREIVLSALSREAAYQLVLNAITNSNCNYFEYFELKKTILSSAKNGDVRALALLGQLIMDNEQSELAIALAILELGAQRGSAMAAAYLGNYYLFRADKKDVEKGLRHLRSAAEAGHVQSMYNLSRVLLKGEYQARDEGKALGLLIQVSESDISDELKRDVCNWVGYLIEKNAAEKKEELMKALSWYRRSAELSMPEGNFNAGRLSVKVGLINDANRFYEIASSLGVKEANIELAKLKAKKR